MILITGGNGYIGSRLSIYLASVHHKVQTVDLCLFSGSNPVNYKDLTKEYIQSFDAVIHLAGHSSVPWCDNDPLGSMSNNCDNFFHLVSKISPKQKFIYASSASIYGNCGTSLCSEVDILNPPIKEYDRQKQMIDLFMQDSNVNYFGLRFGTVCGYSLVPRNELLINSMVRDAITKRKVVVNSSQACRAVLGLRDLCRAMKILIENNIARGIYNLASFNTNMENAGKFIANKYSAELVTSTEGENKYSFNLYTDLFTYVSGMRFEETLDSISEEASSNNFSKERKWNFKI